MADETKPAREAALIKIDRALEHLQQSQNHLDWAMQELCDLSYGNPTCNRVQQVREKVNALWHRLNGSHAKFVLDHQPTEDELAKLREHDARTFVAARVCSLEATRSTLRKMSEAASKALEDGAS